jgi:uncharacterized membrane protein YgdD (TMEM256/DUF423 family)
MNINLIFGALLGFISVAFGAYAEHGLKASISVAQFESLMTAVRYNQVHAIIIVALSIIIFAELPSKLVFKLKLITTSFVIGTVLFSFSIYASVLLQIKELTRIAPIGGTILMVSWLSLIWPAICYKNQCVSKKPGS